MKFRLRMFNRKLIVTVCLLGTLTAVTAFPGRAEAMFITGTPHEDALRQTQPAGERAADIDSIRKTLESAVVRQRLMDLGLSPDEAMARINRLSDDQIHQFASRLDSLQAGGHHGHFVVVLLLIIVILLLI